MFWRMTGLTTVSPVEGILDKENFTLEELLDEDEIIQECKALNGRLINFLREKSTIKRLIEYIVEEPSEDSERQQRFKFSFISCEIFTCEIDIILKALVDDEELMGLLFSFLDPGRLHSNLLAGYFSKVVMCLLLRKTYPLMNYIHGHQEIINRLVDLIGITSVMEVLIRVCCADDVGYMRWLEDINVPEMLIGKFNSSDCPEVHANAAEALCSISRYAPSGLAYKISSPSFISILFHHALEDSRPKSVLINLLSVCISLLDPKRLPSGAYYMYARQTILYSGSAANTATVQGMLENLGGLLKLLDISSEDQALITTYGMLQPPLGRHRLKIIEFVSVLLAVGNEAVEKELIQLDAMQRILDLFFEYPFNNFLHHYVERILISCMESTNSQFVEYLLHHCNIVGRMLEAEKNCTLAFNLNKPTLPVEGRQPPRIGNIGHLTRIANKLVQLANSNSEIQAFLQDNSDWVNWHTNILVKRNALENVSQWTCGRPNSLQDRVRDSDDDDYQDRDYDVAALANNLSQAFRYGIYSNDTAEEVHGSNEHDDEDMYFDDESAEVVISSLRLGDDEESASLFSNSNWFAFSDERMTDENAPGSVASSSPTPIVHEEVGTAQDKLMAEENNDFHSTGASILPEPKPELDDNEPSKPSDSTKTEASDKLPGWVDRGPSSEPSPSTSSLELPSEAQLPLQPNPVEPEGAIPSPASSATESTGTSKPHTENLPRPVQTPNEKLDSIVPGAP